MSDLLPHKPELARHCLDTVRDCRDLYGTFPPDVSFHFVYYMHDDLGNIRRSPQLPAMAQAVKDADTVAVEIGYVTDQELLAGQSPGDYTDRLFQLMNEEMRHGLRPENKAELFVDFQDIGTFIFTLGAYVVHKFGLAREDLPPFVPVDVYAEARDPRASIESFHATPSDETLFDHASEQRHREATVLRQLHELAQRHDTHHIVALQGATHDLTSVAAAVLGADVRQTYLYPPVTYVEQILTRRFRLSGPDSDHPPQRFVTEADLAQIRDVDNLAYATQFVYDALRGHKYTVEMFDRYQVAPFVTRVYTGGVTAEQRHTWDTYLRMAQAYVDGEPTDMQVLGTALDQYEALLAAQSVFFK